MRRSGTFPHLTAFDREDEEEWMWRTMRTSQATAASCQRDAARFGKGTSDWASLDSFVLASLRLRTTMCPLSVAELVWVPFSPKSAFTASLVSTNSVCRQRIRKQPWEAEECQKYQIGGKPSYGGQRHLLHKRLRGVRSMLSIHGMNILSKPSREPADHKLFK